MAEINTIIAELKAWKKNVEKDIPIEKVYLFGSAIYKNGALFDPKKSDLDLIVKMPEIVKGAIDRRRWITSLKAHKAELEKQMVFLLGRENTNKEIVSIVPITQRELDYDIHKGGTRSFFRDNDFLDIDSTQIIKGKDILNYIPVPNELNFQVFAAIQKTRNAFLKNCALTDHNLLRWDGDDVIPKDLAREAAKVNSLIFGTTLTGDEFNISYGTDFLKNEIRKRDNSHEDYSVVYNWLDSRTGGRSVTKDRDHLSSDMHLILYEVLYDISEAAIDEKAKKEQNESNLIMEEFYKKNKIDDGFEKFLRSSDLLTKAHSRKEEVLLNDIFVFPELRKHEAGSEKEKIENLEVIINNFSKYSKIIIAGENQSGKTTICKKYFTELRKSQFVPIYIQDRVNNYLGSIESKIEKAFSEQYPEFSENFKNINKKFIVPIIDDFHFAKHKEKLISELAVYPNQIIIVDDIFGLNLREEKIISSYSNFKIEEFIPSLRNNLIKNWISLNDRLTGDKPDFNSTYQNIDKSTELVNAALGKIIGSGIMPSYPFFILSVISTYETIDKPLEQEITSQGYCYQALLYMYLRKQGVKNDEVDTYINFLSELSFYVYNQNKTEIDEVAFNDFIENTYLSKYNLPVSLETLISNLDRTNIFCKNSLNNYFFCYQYIYYFFVGKYLADNIDANKTTVEKILNNLHNNDNAYISIFISHHSKSSFILEEIVKTASGLFSKYPVAKLSQEELAFFDEKADIIVKAVLPDKQEFSAEKVREQLLRKQDKEERKKLENAAKTISKNIEKDDDFAKEMRRSFKTVEVMGMIIKNRSGSILKSKLESVFEEGMNVHLRIIGSFIDLIKDETRQSEIVDMIRNLLTKAISDKGANPSADRLESMSKAIFWNTNFSVIYTYINKVIHSLGSDKLTQIIQTVCDRVDTPATFIIKHGIFMWYNKNLQIDNIADKIDTDGFSKTAKHIINHKVVNHCRLHSIGFKDLQKIESRLEISKTLLLKKKEEGKKK
jgi:hypothetical protein